VQWTQTYKLLEPFLLLIATAILTGYLAPKITQRWQNHQKALELKTSFVSEINENVLQIVMATQYAELRAASQTQEDFDKAYSTWEVQKAIIGATLRSYFPQTSLGKDWDEFSEVVTEFYALTGTSDPGFREKRLKGLKEYFGKYFDTNAVSWETLANLGLKASDDLYKFQDFMRAWHSLRKLVLKRKDALVQSILADRIAFFDS
jgi:hypothetical protein